MIENDGDGSIDFNTLLEWMETGDRDLQLSALEHLCMTLLMSDNVDRCFENCPPRQFMPALCKLFIDEAAPINVLEASARAMTYYMEVSNECSRRITAVDGTVKAICDRIANMTTDAGASRELSEQCVKVLEHICQRETGMVYEAGGFSKILALVRDYGNVIHKDTLRSAMTVITRLCSKIEPDDAIQEDYSVTLGTLLTHNDLRVSESALRSIAAVVDRFLRKNMDPCEFAIRCGLVDLLLGLIVEPSGESTSIEDQSFVLTAKPISFISIVLSLLSNLCRGSATATDLVVRSNKLMPVLRAVMMSKDERCIMDGLRLTGMILGLICEGRQSITRIPAKPLTEGALSSKFTQKHKQVIECIRNKDFTAFKNAIDAASVDVNYTDDVGQALLNWVAAFGTVEMAKFLLEKGANVDGGNRSSSLHYAAIFGRPDIARLLLENGANPELRDEEGKTPLEKARERHEEGHKQVARLLESPLTKSTERPEVSAVDSELFNSILLQLVPMFCTVNKAAFSANIRRSSLSLMKKCIMTVPADDLRTAIMQDNFTNEFADNFLGMFETALDSHDDAEAREQVLTMMQSLLERDTDFWREQITRLGVHEKVEALAQEVITDDDEEDSTSSDAPVLPRNDSNSSTSNATPGPSSIRVDSNEFTQVPVQIFRPVDSSEVRRLLAMADAIGEATASIVSSSSPLGTPPPAKTSRLMEARERLLSTAKNLKWKDWRIIHYHGVTFMWCDAVAFQFNEDGTTQYLFENKLGQTNMFCTTQRADDTERNRMEFTRMFLNTKEAVVDLPISPIFDNSKNNWVGFGHWDFLSADSFKVEITCSSAPSCKLEIYHDIPGFTYHFDDDATASFMADCMLGAVYCTGWIKAVQVKPDKKSAKRERVKEIAEEIWEKYLKHCKNNMRAELKALQANAKTIMGILKEMKYENVDQDDCERRLFSNLEQVRDALMSDNTLSVFEIAHSGIVKALCYVFANCVQNTNGAAANAFQGVFADDFVLPIVARKIVLVLEALEKFPVIKYDKPNSTVSGMKLLTRRIRLQLEQADPDHWLQQKLLNNTGRQMKTEPLCSVALLKHYLINMLSKFWFDCERPKLEFVNRIQECKNQGQEMCFQYTSDFDTNGIIYYIGTNGLTEEKWVNPATVGLVKVCSSDGKHMSYEQAEAIISRDAKPLNCHTADVKGANFVIDLGVFVYPSVYTLRHAEGYNRSALRNWTFEGSIDNTRWYVISRHNKDDSLSVAGDTASWSVNSNTGLAFRYFRIVQQGFNASGKTYYLSLSGFEIYGTVVDVVAEPLPALIVSRLYNRHNPKYSGLYGTSSHMNQHGWVYKPPVRASGIPTMEDSSYASHRAAVRASFSQFSGENPAYSSRTNPESAETTSRRSEKSKLERNKHRLNRSSIDREFSTIAGPINNAYPPIPLQDQIDVQMTDLNESPQGPTIKPRKERSLIEPKLEDGFPNILRGFNVRSLLPEKALSPYGRALTENEKGKVRVLWDSGETETVRYGKDGHYDCKVLANQLPRISSNKTSDANFMEVEPSSTSGLNPSGNAISQNQKSMSTTNLFDERKSRRSVASTNQAASAESLQHQTPSLENLLSRARLFHERIPEAGDEHSQANTPEPSTNEQNLTVSVAASTFGGGSHPVLSTTRRSIDSSEPSAAQSHVSVNSSNSSGTPQQSESEAEAMNARFRSVWAPILAEGVNFNEEDEAEVQSPPDVEMDIEAEADADEEEDDEYYVYQVVADAHQDNDIEVDVADNTNESSEPNTLGLNPNQMIGFSFGIDEPSASPSLRFLSRSRDTPPQRPTVRAIPPSRPSRYSTYTEALRNVMQQVLEAGGHEEIEDDMIFNDEFDEEGTDETEEDIEDVIAQGLVSVVQAEDSQQRRLMGFSRTTSTSVGGNNVVIDNTDAVPRISRIPASDAARMAIRNMVSIPPRFYDLIGGAGSSHHDPSHHNSGARPSRKSIRQWDDDFTLKPSYSSLIPVFDPRPGRNNVNQTEDIELPIASGNDDSFFKRKLSLRSNYNTASAKPDIKAKDLRLFLTGPNIAGIKNATVELDDDENKLLFYIHRVLNLTECNLNSGKRANTKIWEPTYTLTYEIVGCHPSTVTTTPLNGSKIHNGEKLELPVKMALDAITFLKEYLRVSQLGFQSDTFISEKITQKITQELGDPLLVSANALSEWCPFILNKHKHLFTLDTRRNYLMATAFGTTRSIVWAQTLLDQANEQGNQSQVRRDDSTDFRVGRLKHERIKVPRSDDLFDTAMRVLKFHAVRKSVLEIQYLNEEGTGLGPTLEFYALVAAEFQRKSRAIWICDDDDHVFTKVDEVETDLGSGKKPPGYYVRRPGGLFPAPIPPNTPESEKACNLFRVLGIFLGKVIQDGRLVDLPLAIPLLKLLCLHPDNFALEGQLSLDDFSVVHQEKAEFIRELNNLRAKRDVIWNDSNLSREQRFHKIRSLRLDIANTKCSLDELGLTFVVDPPSNVFQYRGYELVDDGANVEVTLGNVDDYVEKVLDFHLNTGIRPQIEAFRHGFSLVCPLSALSIFTPEEFLIILCGDQTPQWTLEELQKYTVPKNGYTHESTTFKRFIQILVEMDPIQRKSFLQFATGCSSLPPGGLANLHPPLTIVRKSESGDGAYPSVNTCVHYLKVPDYSTKELLKERLLSATLEKGFYLN